MNSPIERKFDEYVKNIHKILSGALHHLDHAPFVNQLLDRMEYINGHFVVLNSEKEDVFVYQNHLGKLSSYTHESLEWIESYHQSKPDIFENIGSLKENFFLLNDMFATSQNLMKSFYPVI